MKRLNVGEVTKRFVVGLRSVTSRGRRLRAGEAVRLRIRDVDLDRGAIKLDENKTDDPRAWALNPSVALALAIWVDNFRPASTDL
jgi:integrase